MEQAFVGEVVEWRGPAPYYFVPVPEDDAEVLRAAVSAASYGWGMLPIRARIGSTEWKTSLFPKDDGYWLPLKDAVRKPHGLDAGDTVEVELILELSQAPGRKQETARGQRTAREQGQAREQGFGWCGGAAG
ncbi:DUF1905 domain-containing protein [Kribbella sp. NPDC048915]|uniref:DUF1905 domain-containing protein n=1 Tax=Kribbella sp. NPDC048915 TaxID=3155148 RepID=UPI003402CAFD